MAHFFEKEVFGEKIGKNRADWQMRKPSCPGFSKNVPQKSKRMEKPGVLRQFSIRWFWRTAPITTETCLTIVRCNISFFLQSLVAVNTLLGCFLPRLSRATSAVFFVFMSGGKASLFGSQRRAWRIRLHMHGQLTEKHPDRLRQHRKIALRLQRRFIDIKAAVDLDL